MTEVTQNVEQLVVKAQKALAIMKDLSQFQVDQITESMCMAGVAYGANLAEMAVRETGIGKVDDKIVKNYFASQVVYDYMKDKKSVGIIDETDGIISIAEPYGIIAGVTPTTNPTATTMFKIMSALKGRNVIIFAFHPRAQECSAEAARVMLEAAVLAGAPQDSIQWIEKPSVDATNALMKHPEISMIIATGGGAMVKAAYSSGHPALGVGPGNVPVYIEKTADLDMAVSNVIASKTFDYGTLCLTEQSVIFDDEQVAEKTLRLFKEKGAYLCDGKEKDKLEQIMFDKKRGWSLDRSLGNPRRKLRNWPVFSSRMM